MIDKNYCMSSYLAFRYIEDDSADFYEGITHTKNIEIPQRKKVVVYDHHDVAKAYQAYVDRLKYKKIGILLSGGMDSACLASFLPAGTDAYTFNFTDVQGINVEKTRAEQFAQTYNLNLHYVDINWAVVEKNIDAILLKKGSPCHSIEPQIMEAALHAKDDGCEIIFVGGGDVAFGGMSKMLSREWDYDDWVDFYTFCKPEEVLVNPVSVDYVYRRYMLPNNKFDYMRFMNEIFGTESDSSYCNAIITAGFDYDPSVNPSEIMQLGVPLDIERIRNGDTKYIVRQLFAERYPTLPVPDKNPMPRPVDFYFREKKKKKKNEFKKGLDMAKFTGNQKWQMWCLERFLNLMEPLQ